MSDSVATTKRQREIMRHALGITSTARRPLRIRNPSRNYFVTGLSGENLDECRELERLGLMWSRPAGICEGYVYFVTEAGMRELE